MTEFFRSSNDTKFHAPNLSFTTEGGSLFPVSEPGIVISIQVRLCPHLIYTLKLLKSSLVNKTLLFFPPSQHMQQHEYIYCLAVVRSNKLNIIGRKSFLSSAVLIHTKPY